MRPHRCKGFAIAAQVRDAFFLFVPTVAGMANALAVIGEARA
jgi:hypothetical protein